VGDRRTAGNGVAWHGASRLRLPVRRGPDVVDGTLRVLESLLDDGANKVAAHVAVAGLDDHLARRIAADHQFAPELISDLVAVVHGERAPRENAAVELAERELAGLSA